MVWISKINKSFFLCFHYVIKHLGRRTAPYPQVKTRLDRLHVPTCLQEKQKGYRKEPHLMTYFLLIHYRSLLSHIVGVKNDQASNFKAFLYKTIHDETVMIEWNHHNNAINELPPISQDEDNNNNNLISCNHQLQNLSCMNQRQYIFELILPIFQWVKPLP